MIGAIDYTEKPNYHWIESFLHETLNTCAVRDAPPARTGELLGIWRGQQFPFFIGFERGGLL